MFDDLHFFSSYLEDRDKFDRDSSLIIPVIRKVFNEWSRHSRLTFIQVNSHNANIVISFQKPNHPEIDNYPMTDSILAHAFFPQKGDVHIRNDLNWNFGEKPLESHERSFFRVLLHEIGHSLGMRHSQDSNSIMFAYYNSLRNELHYDDINGIQHLYGTPLHMKATTKSVSSIDQKVDKCDFNSIDAIVDIRGELMLFKDRNMWRLAYGHDKHEIRGLWSGLPDNFTKIDAIYETVDNEIWIFIGNEIYIFNGTDFSRTISLSHLGISQNVEKIDAIFKWHKNHATYLLSGDFYWRLGENLEKILENYPKLIDQAWREVRDVDSIYDDGEKLLVFKGKYYYEFNDQKMRLNWTQPHSIATEFMNCTVVTNRFNLHELEDENEVKDYIIYGDEEIPEYPDDDENIEKMNGSSDELIANIRLPILIFSSIWILVY